MKRYFTLVPFGFMLLSGCASHKNLANKPGAEELIFQSGFESDSKLVHVGNGEEAGADIVGKDNSLSIKNDWVNDLENHAGIGKFSIQYQGGDSTMRFAKIIPEPGNPTNKVLQFWLNAPNVQHSKGRIQANLYGGKGLKEMYQSVRMFLPDDFNTVKKYTRDINWLTIAEFWNNITWAQTIPYRFRVTLGIGKPTAAPGDPHFILDAEDCELFADGKQKYTKVWKETNKAVKVPVGKWFTMDWYFKEGNKETGRFYMAITPEGEKKQVVFDVHNYTHNTADPNPDGISDFNPLKLYTSKELIEFMQGEHKTLQIYWDDFKLWKNKRP